MKKLATILAMFMCFMVVTSFTVSAQDSYKHYDITDKQYTAGTELELNSIDEGLRQAINDTVQNFEGCTVSFKVTYSNLASDVFTEKEKAVLVANDYFKAYADIDGSCITFKWDELIPKHNMYGMVHDIKLISNDSFTVTDVYVYAPEQKIVSLSAGAGCEDLAVPIVG